MLTSEDQELIEEEKKFYSEISDYINDILDNSFIEPIKDYELTIYSILYRIDELLDVLCVMTENSLINAGRIYSMAFLDSPYLRASFSHCSFIISHILAHWDLTTEKDP